MIFCFYRVLTVNIYFILVFPSIDYLNLALPSDRAFTVVTRVIYIVNVECM